MRTLSTAADFKAFRLDPRGIVIAYFDWSKRGLKAFRLVTEWEPEWFAQFPDSDIRFYSIDHTRQRDAAGWIFGTIRNERGMTGGFGAVGWTIRGSAFRRIPSALAVGKAGLTRLTLRYMGTVPPKTRSYHFDLTMPKGGEKLARSFYSNYLGFREIPLPKPLHRQGGVWFDAGGFDIHLSVEKRHRPLDRYSGIPLDCPNVPDLRAKLESMVIVPINPGPPPKKHFLIKDPFDNHISITEPHIP